MEFRKLTDDLSVSGQIAASDIPTIAKQGFRTIICNRPDGESPDQPAYREIENAAAAHGLKMLYLPVQTGGVTDADALAFAAAACEAPKPALAYCRSGTRCAMLWSLGEAPRRPAADILARARAAGYDLAGLLPRIEKLRKDGDSAPPA